MYDDERSQIRTTEVLKGDYPGLEEENSHSAVNNENGYVQPEAAPVNAGVESIQPEAAPVNAGVESVQPETASTEQAAVNAGYENVQSEAAAAGQAYADTGYENVRAEAMQDTQAAANTEYESVRNEAASLNNAGWQNTYYQNGMYQNAGVAGTANQYQGTYRQMNPDYRANPYPVGNIKEEPVKKKEKKQPGFFGRLCRVAAIGLVFGLFAGGGFLAVKYGAGLFDSGKDGKEQKPVTVSYTESASAATEATQKVSAPAEDPAVVIPASEAVTTIVTDVSSVVDEVMPSIVSITNTGTVSYYYYSIPSESRGSGIIIGSNDEELLMVTNYHVVAENDTLTVSFYDGSEAEALVKGSDSSMDLAVIAVRLDDISDSTMNAIRIARMGDSDALKVGEPAIAIGNALGYGQSVTTGVVSALNRELDMDDIKGTFIQTDAAINPGNSGGALLNINGEVIGINSSKIGGTKIEGMGYAIPISAARPIIEELMQKTTRTLVPEDERGYLGITGATVTQQEIYLYGYPEGVYVASVNDGSAADRAGMERGDYITEFDGEKITSMEGLQRLLMYYREGETVEVKILRENGNDFDELTLQLTLGDKSVLGNRN